jgi:hypothetical protein
MATLALAVAGAAVGTALLRVAATVAVALIVDWPKVLFGDFLEKCKLGHLGRRPPHRYGNSTVVREHSAQLPARRRFVAKELQPLLADHCIEALLRCDRQCLRGADAPIDVRRPFGGHIEHRLADVDTDDLDRVPELLLDEARDDAGAAGNVEHSARRGERKAFERHRGEGPEQRTDEVLLVHLRKARGVHRVGR